MIHIAVVPPDHEYFREFPDVLGTYLRQEDGRRDVLVRDSGWLSATAILAPLLAVMAVDDGALEAPLCVTLQDRPEGGANLVLPASLESRLPQIVQTAGRLSLSFERHGVDHLPQELQDLLRGLFAAVRGYGLRGFTLSNSLVGWLLDGLRAQSDQWLEFPDDFRVMLLPFLDNPRESNASPV